MAIEPSDHLQDVNLLKTQILDNSELDEVTVYRQGALITRTGELILHEGENLLSKNWNIHLGLNPCCSRHRND